jgi:hypothetical protein
MSLLLYVGCIPALGVSHGWLHGTGLEHDDLAMNMARRAPRARSRSARHHRPA